ncbi:ABC transporter ATP-binding protein [uncultured Desulfobacter sp.]|uniref:ABC transporter ATP-binding protein n=1 Tax=uncultured Desulfobacter sp. TaxID=240139 RepID=UPI0029F51121|nr:ABC transporter ATP-binding protein [uncultured Desulfobacter sp.]
MTPSPLVKIENITLGFGRRQVLSNISFDVSPGRIISIIGPNGAGKTSLLRTVCGNLKPFKGKIVLNGNDIATQTRADIARQMAVVRQNQEPMPMKVQPYVLLGRLPFFKPFQFFETRKDLELARHFMTVTGILDLADSAMDQISGGERQLAALARALTQEPEFLVLDEPTAHLDITHQARILDLISGLRDRLGLTVLMVIHDLNLAAEYSDDLLLLNKEKGQIHAMGTPEKILTRENIQAVYHTPVRVEKNPESGRPWVFIDRTAAYCNSL